MFRFLCFNSRVHNPKLKKPVQPPHEAMHGKVQEYSPSVDSTTPSGLLTFSLNSGDRQTNNTLKDANDSASVEPACNSEDMNLLNIGEVPQRASLKKSQSVGDGLADRETIAFADNITKYGTDGNFVCDSSNYQNGLLEPDEHRLTEMQKSSQISSYITQNRCEFATGDARHSPSEKDAHESSRIYLSDEYGGGSSGHTTCGPTRIMKSHSLPIIGTFKPPSGKSYLGNTVPRSRSYGNLHALDQRLDVAIFEFDGQAISKRNDCIIKSEKRQFDNALDGGSESYNYSGPTRDWIMPTMDEAIVVKTGQGSIASRNEMPSKDFKIKRITDWVNDLELSGLLEEPSTFSESIDEVSRDTNTSVGLASAKLDDKISAGMEAAKKYISSLSPTATNVQLTNHGLVVVPFLVAFVSLKMLNLSGNAIVRITAGALPRGLHMLNLSKNNISNIEGLRELSRLRVLDLSYNRILRIGHGLASCSSLKELYLAGNKISEVEGLHRLLKLNILDLRFNKISTAKCLDQLAANYVSLQAISLEGNPAQKNVGDEHLKKYLQSLLPYLVNYNRLPIKANTLKDLADRTVGIGVNSHQFDRSLRSDHRISWKVGHGSSAYRPPASSSHVRRSNTAVSPKHPREKHDNLRQIASKAATSSHHQHHHLNLGRQNLVIASDVSMRRSRSEGTLGAV